MGAFDYDYAVELAKGGRMVARMGWIFIAMTYDPKEERLVTVGDSGMRMTYRPTAEERQALDWMIVK